MFKKPLRNLKTSGTSHSTAFELKTPDLIHFTAPLRGSDRKKLKQSIVQRYALQPEDGDLLVPEGLLSQKFSTHLNEPGVRCYH